MYVVGIGASAGGLEALERFFDHLPDNTGMAFVIVQHLSPDFKSVMGELLARHTRLPIRLVEDGMPIEADHVYLIPPRKEMIIAGGRLLLSERDRQYELTLPIDVFFRSLAQDCGPRAVAIVLSGGGSDGSRGIRDVRDAGGLVIVQDASAQFDGMPRTAIDAGAASFVLPPEQMPATILEHAKERRRTTEPPPPAVPRDRFERVYRKLEQEFGIDFTHYKPSTVTRRIERRLQLARSRDLDAYIERLKQNREELDVLYRDLLIGVTRFFRNEEAFEMLGERILPDLIASRSADTPVRIWVAGCATGEEVYSLAIVLHEVLERVGERPVKIFASDVHRGSLEYAARGVYSGETLRHVSRDRIERYFSRLGPSSFQVVPEIRQHIVFAPHNVIRDAPFTRLDLISCRNLLIYLQPAAQQKVLSLFHFGLNRGGILFLGPSETALTNDFETVQRYWRIFRKHSDVRTPVDARFTPTRLPEMRTPAATPRYSLTQLLRTYDLVLDRFMPPGLLINQTGELIHVFSGAERFLRRHSGRQGLDVLEAVDPRLKIVLVGGIQRALREPTTIAFSGVRFDDDKTYTVNLQKVADRGDAGAHVLITFEENDPPPVSLPRTEIDVGRAPREQIAALEAELSGVRENLQAAIEELETSNEELQASNEELLTANEELQSTNEELQSVNEELYTVNAEYQRKIGELTELTNDVNNLLASTDIGSVFLDTQLRVRKFTPQIADTFNLLPQDVGRSIDTFANTIVAPDLLDELKTVLRTGTLIEHEIADRQGRSFFLRILPYRAKGAIDGVVLTLIDMGSMKAAEDALFHERFLLNSLLANVPDRIYFRNVEGRFIRVNDAMAAHVGMSPRDLIDKTPFDVFSPETALEINQQDMHVLKTGASQHYRLERRQRDGAKDEWMVVTRVPLKDRSDKVVGVVAISRDVTEQRLAEQRIHEDVQRRDQFLAMLSHELRNPLGAVVTATALLQDENQSPDISKKLIRIIDRQSQQMARLLDDLLEVSRVTQNKIELRKQRVDLAVITRDAADAVRATMNERDLSFSVDSPPEGLFVYGDPARLLQVQVNILNNAAKYTPKGGHVSLSVSSGESEAVIRVTDDGVGIVQEIRDSIFDLFVQSRRTLDRSDGGLGVGLTLVRSLVAMHGGTVTCESDGAGKGSTFVVRLPLATEVVSEAPLARRSLHVPRGSRVAIVEDNADSRDLLCQLLALSGYECSSAETGTEGIALIDRVRPAVALIDVGLPEIDGFAVAKHIRREAKHPQILLVALTGYGQPADRQRALEAGFDEHLVKPVNPEALLQLLA